MIKQQLKQYCEAEFESIDFISELLANPLNILDVKPLRREEIYE